jgi:hypothetical protein
MSLNVPSIVVAYLNFFAALNSVFLAALNSVLFAAIRISSDSFIAAWCGSFTFARNGGILYTCTSILVHVFVRLYMCVDMQMRSDDIACIDQDNDHRSLLCIGFRRINQLVCIVEDNDRRSILCIGVRPIKQVVFFTELEPSSSDFSAPLDDILPTCDCGCDEDSFASRGVHLRADAIVDTSHNAVLYLVKDVRISNNGILFYLVKNVRVSNFGILFGIIKRAIIAGITVDFCTLWILFFGELKVFQTLLKFLFKALLRFFCCWSHQHLFRGLIIIESNGDVNILQSIKALVILVLHFFRR